MISTTILTVNNIEKNYGTIRSLKNISFTLNRNEITAIIGPNGAGKTTLLRIICTILKPTSGDINFLCCNNHENDPVIRNFIGYMPEDAGLYLNYSGSMNLRFYASFYSDDERYDTRMNHYLNMFDLNPHKKVGQFSKGMKQKLLFIKAVAHAPVIVILDEPFNSMDPQTKYKVKKVLLDMKNEGKAIVLSSHSMADVEGICDKVIILNQGRKIIDESLKTLTTKFTNYSLEDIYLELLDYNELS
jgi:ABC-type multidrug transport system ATPase subunit